jgi:hypothetical protein
MGDKNTPQALANSAPNTPKALANFSPKYAQGVA